MPNLPLQYEPGCARSPMHRLALPLTATDVLKNLLPLAKVSVAFLRQGCYFLRRLSRFDLRGTGFGSVDRRDILGVWKHKGKIAFVLSIVVIYAATLIHNVNESQRRSLELKEEGITGNHIDVSIQVIAFNPASSEMTTRVSFRLSGDLAKDPVTPSEDLKFFVNGILGPQEIEFPRGKRINPVIVVFAIEGNMNHYPFDRYGSAIRSMVTKKIIARRTSPEGQSPPSGAPTDQPVDDFVADTLQEGDPVPINSSIIASIPGFKFHGERVERPEKGIEGFNLAIRRSDNVIVFSVLLMTLMMSLALSVLLMCLSALASSDKLELLPLSLCVSLLFGLPALRNAQPAVPPLGVFGDYVSFIWAETIVATSAVMMIWNWMIRRHVEQSKRAALSSE